jgi:hypothetical protein
MYMRANTSRKRTLYKIRGLFGFASYEHVAGGSCVSKNRDSSRVLVQNGSVKRNGSAENR